MAAPALFLAIPLLLGVLIGASMSGPMPYGTALLLACWAVSAASLYLTPRHPVVAFVGTISLACGCGAAGMQIGAIAARDAARPPLLAWVEANARERSVHVLAVAREDAARTATGVTLTLDVRSVDGHPVAGGARVSVAGSFAADAAPAWRAGRTLALDATLRVPLDYRNPGVPSDRDRLVKQGIVLFGTVKSAALVTVVAHGTVLSEAAAALRAWVRTGTTRAVGQWSASSAGVVTAILIGDRTGLAADDERRLQDAGTYHVIAISGGNIALLTALLVALGRAARLPARSTALASIAVLAFYGYAAGLAPSVLRATLAGMIYLAARAADHRGAALNAVGVAAGFACVVAPLSVLDPGFVLSFGATFAIIVAVQRVAPPYRASRKDRPAGRLMRWTLALVFAARALGAATLCAEIALAPVAARLFGRVSLAGLVLNFAAIPLMSIIQLAGLAAVMLVRVSAPLGAAAGWIAHAGTVGLLWSASLVDVLPWLVCLVPPPAWWVITFWYAGWGTALIARTRRMRLVAASAICVAILPVAFGMRLASSERVVAAPAGWTRVVMLDVGQGDATLLIARGASAVLIDAGGVPGSTFDLGRRVTLPAVWAFGVRALSVLALTHGDPDHIGGAPALLRALTPGEIWEGVPVPRHELLQRLRAAAERAHIPWLERHTGDALTLGDVTLRVLNPPVPDWERQRVRNDDSIVIEARVGDVAVILPGDITQAVEPAVLVHAGAAPLTIVKAPHHGSAGSSSPRFVADLHPAAVIFSAGRRNPFGHPAPLIVDRYRAAGARVFSTADDGAVVIDTDGRTVVMWCPATGRRDVLTSGAR